MHGFQLWANLPAVAQDDRAALPGSESRRYSRKSPMTTARRSASSAALFWGKKGPVDGIAADPIYLDVSVPPGRRKTLPVETTRHAFAYVFAGSGKFCNASGPLAVPTEGVGWLDTAPPHGGGQPLAGPLRPRRRSRGASRRRRHPLPAGLGQAARGAGGLVRPDRDEYAGATTAGVRGAAGRDVPENRKMIGWLGSASSTPPVRRRLTSGTPGREPAARPQPPRSRGLSTPSGECEPGAPAKVRDSKRLHPWLRHLFFPSAAEPLWASASSSTAISKVLAPLVQTAIASIMPIVGCFVACLFQTQTGRSLPGGCFQWPHFAERRRDGSRSISTKSSILPGSTRTCTSLRPIGCENSKSGC